MSQITATIELDVPADARVGDQFTFTGRARLTQIREETIDVSTWGHEQYVSGETSYEMRVYDVNLEPAASWTQKVRST